MLAKLGVPIVDAARIVEGQAWASNNADGRHYRPIVPLEVFALLVALVLIWLVRGRMMIAELEEVIMPPPPPPPIVWWAEMMKSRMKDYLLRIEL